MKKLDNYGKYLIASRQKGDLRGAGYSASDLIGAGYSLSALRGAGYSASDLRGAGYSASDLIGAGYSLSALRGAGYSLSDLIGAGYSLSDLRGAGYSLSDLRGAGYSASDLREFEEAPVLVNPYSRLLADIKAKKRTFRQSTFGDIRDFDPALNVCGSPMCTAGHLVNMAEEWGYKTNQKHNNDFVTTATILHYKAHPNYPVQDFRSIPQDIAIAYIEYMADVEKDKA